MRKYIWALIDEPYDKKGQWWTPDTRQETTYILQAFFLQEIEYCLSSRLEVVRYKYLEAKTLPLN